MFYETGTVTLSEGATSIAFAGTDLIANVKVGDEFLAAGGSARVTAIADDTHLTIFPAWTGTAGSGMAYKIARGSGWASTAVVSQAVQVLVDRLNAGLLMAPNAYGEMGTSARDAYDGQAAGFLYLDVPPDGSTDPAVMYVKLSDADADWSEGITGPGMGDLVGPASAVNNRLAAFDGATGKLIKDSGKAVTDFGTAAQGALAATAVQPARTINAGTGLTGGGSLASDRTLALSSGSIASLALADAAAPAANPTFTGQAKFATGSAGSPSIAHTGDTDTGIYLDTDIVGFSTAATFAALFDPSQRFIVGHTASVATGAASGNSPRFQLHGINAAGSSITVYRWSNDIGGGQNGLAKSRGTSAGSRGALSSGDTIGTYNFFGDDGANFPVAASVSSAVDGSTGSGDMPGRLMLNTTADGASAPTERLRIDNTGALIHRNNAQQIVDANSHLQLRSYTVGTLPSAATAGQWVYASNETGGATPVFSDGTNWRRVSDRSIAA